MSQPDLTLQSRQPLDLPKHQINAQVQKLSQQGNDCAFRGEHQPAIDYYTQALALDPTCVEAYCARGRSSIELRHYAQAETDYTAALKLSPALPLAYAGLALVYYGFQSYPAALKACQQAIDRDLENLDFYRCRAKIHNKLANFELVLADCRTILEQVPNDIKARWLNGIAHYHLHHHKIALFNFHQYLNFRQDNADAYYYLGLCHEQLGDLPQALVELSRAIDLSHNRAISYRKRGRIRQRLGDLTGAMTDFDLAIQLDPRVAQTYCYRADIYLNRGDYTQALTQCDKAIQLNPQLVNAYYQRAIIQTEVGNLHAALADYHRLIQFDPLDLKAYIQRSWIYFRYGKYAEAMKDCEQVLTIDPTSVPANYLLGVVRSLSGFKQEAIFSFTKVLDLYPNFICALYHRGILRYDLKDESKAMADFRAARSIQDSGEDCSSMRDETGLYAEGLALYQMGQPETARAILQQAAVVAEKLKSLVFHQQITFTLEALGMD
jgi:tetratricopeptide (TPR) repeat protein